MSTISSGEGAGFEARKHTRRLAFNIALILHYNVQHTVASEDTTCGSELDESVDDVSFTICQSKFYSEQMLTLRVVLVDLI